MTKQLIALRNHHGVAGAGTQAVRAGSLIFVGGQMSLDAQGQVLKAPDVPSVLIELGYVSNKQDLKLMMSEPWRAKTSDAVAQAISTFFATRLAGSGPGPGAN